MVQALREMSIFLQLRGESGFKVRAYDVAADRIAGLSEDLGALVAEDRLTELPGIGASLGQKISELVRTGRMEALETERRAWPPRVLELLDVPELGPKKARALVEQLGVGSLDDLEKACRQGQVRALKGFGARTEEKLLANLALARRTLEGGSRKRLGDVLPLAEELLSWVKAAPGVQRASLGGSVRRMRETVADADIIASAPDAAPVFAHFAAHPKVAEVIGAGESKSSVRLRELDLQADLRVLPDEDFASALHHFTGSKAHHIRLRALAQEKGYTISEWGVFRLGDAAARQPKGHSRHEGAEEKLRITSEADLYALLGMQAVPPELREDTGEVEAALAGTLPTRLIEAGDLRGLVHVHTTWSDGRDSLLDMARAARALGAEYLTITDHSPSSTIANGLDAGRLQAQWEELARVAEAVPGLRLLRGIECDILADGALDLPDAILEQLDVVIGSVHQRHGLDEAAMTKRVLRAFDNPHLMVWGHPTGRLLLEREPAPLRMEALLDAAAERGIVVEVNGAPERLDLAPAHVRAALERGVQLCVSTDAHDVGALERNVRFGAAAARRGWATPKDVVNTLDADAFLARLHRRRRGR